MTFVSSCAEPMPPKKKRRFKGVFVQKQRDLSHHREAGRRADGGQKALIFYSFDLKGFFLDAPAQT
jgi:hypothetical protein